MKVDKSMDLIGLGTDVHFHIAKRLDLRSLARLEQVSVYFNDIARHPSIYLSLRRVTVVGQATVQTICDGPHMYPREHSSQCLSVTVNSPFTQESPLKVNDEGRYEERGFALQRFLPRFLRHILLRGAQLISLEILGDKADRVHDITTVKTTLLAHLTSLFAEHNVRLVSLVLNQIRFDSEGTLSLLGCGPMGAAEQVVAELVLQHSTSLRTLAIGRLYEADSNRLLFIKPPPTLTNLRHLLLFNYDQTKAREWMGLETGRVDKRRLQLLLVKHNDDDQLFIRQLKEAEFVLELREQKDRLVLAVPRLNEVELQKGILHSLDLLKDLDNK